MILCVAASCKDSTAGAVRGRVSLVGIHGRNSPEFSAQETQRFTSAPLARVLWVRGVSFPLGISSRLEPSRVLPLTNLQRGPVPMCFQPDPIPDLALYFRYHKALVWLALATRYSFVSPVLCPFWAERRGWEREQEKGEGKEKIHAARQSALRVWWVPPPHAWSGPQGKSDREVFCKQVALKKLLANGNFFQVYQGTWNRWDLSLKRGGKQSSLTVVREKKAAL